MEKNVNTAGNLPVSHTEVFGLLNSRIHEQKKAVQSQDEKIGLLLEIIHFQNKAIKSSKAIDSGLMENASAADICIAELQEDCLSKEADKEAA